MRSNVMRGVLGLLVGLAVAGSGAAPALADNKRELLIEKVMLETAIAKGRLLVDLGEIQAKAESVAAGLASP